MEERRTDKRVPIGIKLSISNLYKEDTNTIMDLDLNVEVVDISSKGIGFVSRCILPVGYYFIANIELSPELPQIITDVRVIRSAAIDKEQYRYGCEFVSISPSVGKLLDEFSEGL
ncbi:MAG: PilZ domain-containing protein [Lachnospiraceae bacterium]|nr:PilZ domain-containing protein [Lachnospiraceae bacterium]